MMLQHRMWTLFRSTSLTKQSYAGAVASWSAAARRHVSTNKFDRFGDRPLPLKKQRLVPTSGTYPRGFEVGSVHVGIKPASKSQPDLVSIVSAGPKHACSAAAVFTRNEFPAASITVSKKILQTTGGHGIGGVVANSWCANTLTGAAGLEDSAAMVTAAGECLTKGQEAAPFMVMHTGVGGQKLPIEPILENMPTLADSMGSSHQHWLEAAWGLATTDTFPKLISRTFTLPSWGAGTRFSIAGITKGAGMVCPNMHTTLGIFCTDAPVAPAALQRLLSVAADHSYNCISIDGDTSTNDMVALLANGAAASTSDQDSAPENRMVDWDPSSPSGSEDFSALQRAVSEVLVEAARLVVRDAEGASKFLTIRVRGCPDGEASRQVASAIARSSLVKTALYGGDPNPGGILAVLGCALVGTRFAGRGLVVPGRTSISFATPPLHDDDAGARAGARGPVAVAGLGYRKFLDRGVPVEVEEAVVREMMAREDVEVVVDLGDDGGAAPGGEELQTRGEGEAVFWTSDLTHDFVTINSGIGS